MKHGILTLHRSVDESSVLQPLNNLKRRWTILLLFDCFSYLSFKSDFDDLFPLVCSVVISEWTKTWRWSTSRPSCRLCLIVGPRTPNR
jgi:hypothetical protein